ncbi:MAG: hypothetical protein OEV42_10940 [Deltaproteobacteria bacterium]|nr:hypothetical protein [Deltaproteobacteria bacterium]
MKRTIFITLAVMGTGLAAFLLLNYYSPIQTSRPSRFDANDQALSNGLIAIDKKALPQAGGKVAAYYDAACAFCHDLPDPASHDAIEWAYVVDRMEELIIELKGREKKILVPWDGEIKKEVLAYLEEQAFQGMNPDDLPHTPEKGAKLYKAICASCHTLPDPSMHSLVVWEYVLSKMQHFQKDMALPVMSEEEVAALLEYLKPLSR